MDIKTFLSKLWLEIKSLFEELPADLQQAALIAVSITESVKTVIDNPAVDILTAVVPGEFDNKLVLFLRLRLPAILWELRLVDRSLTDQTDNQVVSNAVSNIQSLDGDIQHSFLHDLAVLIVREIASFQAGNISWSDAVYVVEWFYQNKFKKA